MKKKHTYKADEFQIGMLIEVIKKHRRFQEVGDIFEIYSVYESSITKDLVNITFRDDNGTYYHWSVNLTEAHFDEYFKIVQ